MRKHLVLSLSVALLLLVATSHRRDVVSAAATGRLVANEPMNTMCIMPGEAPRQSPRPESGLAAAGNPAPPVRIIRDTYPSCAAIAVDMVRDEVVVTDESLFQILVYDRTENTPAGAEASRPKRVIAAEHQDPGVLRPAGARGNSQIEFQSGVYVDQKTGDIYTSNNDTSDKLSVFKHGSNGDVKPLRQVETPHGGFGVVIDEVHQELFLTVQHDHAIVVYRKNTTLEESPIRYFQGRKTGLQDPHGIAFDPQEDVLFVANHGSTQDVAWTDTPRSGVQFAGNRRGKENWPLGTEFGVAGSGTINPPSITVHARTASGNTPPLRTIQGPNTGLNWPTGLAFDPQAREVFVANDAAHEILVFNAAASGNARPTRILKGPRTKLANPTSVFADTKNRELWVANFGGHSATVYDISASGDVAPKRIIRNAPEGTPSLMIGNPGDIAFDSKREQILVAN